MIKTSDHGQIFLDYVIKQHKFYMGISLSQNRSLKDGLSTNHFLSKRTPIIKDLCSGFWSLFALHFLQISLPTPMFEMLLNSI